MIYFSQLLHLLTANQDLNRHGLDIRSLWAWWKRPLRASRQSLSSLAPMSAADLILGEGIDGCVRIWGTSDWRDCEAARYLRFAVEVAGSDSLTTSAFKPIWLEWMIGVNQARQVWLDWENSPQHVLIDEAERSEAWSQGLSYIKAGLSWLAASFWVQERGELENSLAGRSERFLQAIEQLRAATELAARLGIEPPALAQRDFIGDEEIYSSLDVWLRTDFELAVRQAFWRAQTTFLGNLTKCENLKMSPRRVKQIAQLMQSASRQDPVRKQEVKGLLSVNREVIDLLLKRLRPDSETSDEADLFGTH